MTAYISRDVSPTAVTERQHTSKGENYTMRDDSAHAYQSNFIPSSAVDPTEESNDKRCGGTSKYPLSPIYSSLLSWKAALETISSPERYASSTQDVHSCKFRDGDRVGHD